MELSGANPKDNSAHPDQNCTASGPPAGWSGPIPDKDLLCTQNNALID